MHFTAGCTAGWSKRFEYSIDQTRHIVYRPHSRLAIKCRLSTVSVIDHFVEMKSLQISESW